MRRGWFGAVDDLADSARQGIVGLLTDLGIVELSTYVRAFFELRKHAAAADHATAQLEGVR
ncbi:hypothetical protein GM1_015_00040 [Gordonia malaquae NBRC 108250]|uniref:Uncharacterized protein n=1 Tax=Gordonia malaquae NBRC 108250 TaxID=1223542 RepID=M3UKI6_GORML|nr:hypothetical protein GM1_015_00040 [Gordonia malaquae NBRC 108250]